MFIYFKKYLNNLFTQAVNLNHKNILDLLEYNPTANFLDLGCDDGLLTSQLADKVNTKNIFGVEINDERIKLAESRNVTVRKFDLNSNFNFESNFFDVIHANQVIEHIHSSDTFLAEVYRSLKDGGYAIISTENASSWCNIGASILGWQIFSLTNFSNKGQGIGNPLALHKNTTQALSSWQHVRIYNIRGLKEYFELYGFTVETIAGAGYFPLPAILGKLDSTHSHFITFKIRKNPI